MSMSSQNVNISIEPKCFPFDKDGNKVFDSMNNCPTHTAAGYVLPCCWLDRAVVAAENDDLNGVRVPELHLDNITYEQIVKSDQWRKFYRQLFEDPENAHQICKDCCGVVTEANGNKTDYFRFFSK